MVEAYPLYWPEGWKRTASYGRTHSRFKTGFAVSRDFLVAEVKRLGGTQVVLSTNVRLRGDGLPYASEREPEDSLDWVICGGESGPAARPMHLDWARALRDQCAAAGVAFFMKQMGSVFGPQKGNYILNSLEEES